MNRLAKYEPTNVSNIVSLPGVPDMIAAPHYERALCGTILHRPETFLTMADIVKPEDFTEGLCQAFWNACHALIAAGEKIDRLPVVSRVATMLAIPQADAHQQVTDLLASDVTDPDNGEQYARVVAVRAMRLRMVNACRDITKWASTQMHPNELLDKANSAWFSATEMAGTVPTDAASSMERYWQELMRRKEQGDVLIPTGYPNLDEWNGGVRRGTVALIAGNNGAGKTQFVMSLTRNMARALRDRGKNEAVVFCSLEMSEHEVNQNWVAMETAVYRTRLDNPATIRATADWEFIRKARDEISTWSHHLIDDKALCTVESIQRRIQALQTQSNVAMVVIDGLWLLKNPNIMNTASDTGPMAHMEHTTPALTRMAKTLDVAVVCTAQYNKSGKLAVSRGDDPELHHVQGSGYATNDVQYVLAMARDRKAPEKPMELHPIKGRGRNDQVVPFYFRYDSSRALYEPVNSDGSMDNDDIQF